MGRLWCSKKLPQSTGPCYCQIQGYDLQYKFNVAHKRQAGKRKVRVVLLAFSGCRLYRFFRWCQQHCSHSPSSEQSRIWKLSCCCSGRILVKFVGLVVLSDQWFCSDLRSLLSSVMGEPSSQVGCKSWLALYGEEGGDGNVVTTACIKGEASLVS